MKNIVVVESPSKTKKLAGFLGKDYEVISSVGHVRDLPKSGLAIDVEKNFDPEYVISPEKTDVVKGLKKYAKQADAIYLATDMDREGEAIAWHVAHIMNGENDLDASNEGVNFHLAHKIKNKSGKNPQVYRVTFNSITKEAVVSAFDNPRKLDDNLINAQQGRRVLDRLVGYKLSPLLWEKIRYGLSAGRVQSVAVRLIVEREREIEKFIKTPFHEFIGLFNKTDSKDILNSKLVKIDDESIYKKEKFQLFAGDYTATKTIIESEKQVEEIKSDIEQASFKVKNVESKEIKSHPSPPFSTSTLQQAASSKLGITPARTMQLAQKLYEGGYITYMRTDSIQLDAGIVQDVRKFVKSKYGSEYITPNERHFKARKGAKTQEAHEAVRPTDVTKIGDDLPKSVNPQQKKLYDLIWSRTVASQMAPAVFDNTNVTIANESSSEVKKTYTFEAKGSVIKFKGYLEVYNNKRSDEILPDTETGDQLDLGELNVESKEMSPPPRYNESSLVKELESFNIGRPSTYASIISTVQTRGYVKKIEKSLHPTDNGLVVNDLLVKHFPQIVDVDFTAEMEESLDLVAEGELEWRKLIKDFYGPFDKLLAEKKTEIKKEDVVVMEKTDEKCPECEKGNLIVKLGKYGKFLSCDQYPDCKFAKPIDNGDEDGEEGGINADDIPELKEPCPECKGKLMLKEGRFGKFIACENYPKCKYTKAVLNKIEMKCPDCGEKHDGEIVVKRTKKGRIFYGCSRYPDCEYASWTNPKNNPEGEGKKGKAKKPAKKKKKA